MVLTHAQRRVLDELLDEAAAFADAGERDKASRSLQAAIRIAPDDPDVRYEQVRWRVMDGDHDAALADLQRVVQDAPHHADARHLLGDLAMAAGQRPLAIEHWTQVLALDQARSARFAGGAQGDLGWIEARAQEVLDALPEPFASRVAQTPVVLEARPHPDIVAEGFDPRALGLFEGTARRRHQRRARARTIEDRAVLGQSARRDRERRRARGRG